ncbi:MAG: ABC transporter ATP-binding protein [Anaerolineae bacterium]|nr:ABC transporter ATP-binding protein [Anaerolineae bacterium]
MTPIIQTERLSKVYQRGRGEPVYALKDLTLAVQPGEVFGYLGPNGAGKTTTIRLLMDFIRPTSGSARIFGQDVRQHSVAIHQRIGFLPGELNLWKNQTGQQVINYISRMRGGTDTSYVADLTERLQFDPSKRIRSYSSGNRRKLGLILALMGKPELLILDEPTGGLDPLMQQIFNEIILEVKGEGRTVFLSSHILSEVQAICDRVGILRNGELKAVERVSDLTHADFRWVTLRLEEIVEPAQLAGIPGVSDVTREDGALRLRLNGDFDPLLRALSPYYVRDIRVQEPSLEEIFLTYYGNGSRLTHGAAERVLAS